MHYPPSTGFNLYSSPGFSSKPTTACRILYRCLCFNNIILSEINLEPQENHYGSRRYESGLMRVAFAKGNPTFAKKLMGGPILCDAEPFRSYLLKEKIGIDNWNKEFHNYTLIWRPGNLILLTVVESIAL